MKLFALCALALTGLLFGCQDANNYLSDIEAMNACMKWAIEGRKSYQYRYGGGEPSVIGLWSRGCLTSDKTRQVLGYEVPGITEGETVVYQSEEGMEMSRKIAKRYRW